MSSSSSSAVFSGKVAIVTGASSGIGEDIAKALAAAGAKVVVNGRDAARLKEVQAHIIKAGGEATIHVGDVRHEAAHKALVELAISTYGALHFAINNAGIVHFHPIEEFPAEHIDDLLDVNVKSVLFGLKHQLPAIGRFSSSAQWGRIINVSSGVTKHSSAIADSGALVYSVSKVAVDQATRLGAAAGRRHHVQVNAVAPGPTRTPGLMNAVGIEGQEKFDAIAGPGILMEKGGSVEDITGLVLFLLGKGGNYIDGAIVAIDGGMAVK